LAANSLDGEQFVPSSGSPTQQAYLSQDKMTKFSKLSRFGMTFKPLTESLGQELLTWYLEGFHAKTSAPQEKGLGSKANEAVCGNTWQESLAKYDHNTFSWKTPRCLLPEESTSYSGTWPKWGSMRNGELFRRQMPGQITSGKESGSLQNRWATPTTMDSLPPKSPEALLREATITRPNRSKPTNLRDQVSNMQNWPTPTTRDYKGKSGAGRQERKGNPKDTLPNAVGGNLNPMWVEWLMGWPLGWTDLKPSATGKSHCVQQQHGES